MRIQIHQSISHRHLLCREELGALKVGEYAKPSKHGLLASRVEGHGQAHLPQSLLHGPAQSPPPQTPLLTPPLAPKHHLQCLLAPMQALKAGETGDEDIIRLAAEDAELARAKERLTLKHRNSSKWARRALKRGMDVMDEGTKAAVAEQLRLGEELRRKVLPPSCAVICSFACVSD